MSLEPTTAQRLFDQHPEAVSFYSDFSQMIGTENEVLLQFYETIPDPPSSAGETPRMRSRLRATIIMSKSHAKTMARNLLQHLTSDPSAMAPTSGA